MAWWITTRGLITAASSDGHQHSSWEHAPELIVVGVAFVAFLGYLRQEGKAQDQLSARPRPDGWRWLTASLLVIAGLGHVPLIEQHLAEAPYMGVLFTLFVICAGWLAIAVFRRGTAIEYAAAGILCVLAVCAYIATRLFAFPELTDDVGAWLEPLGVMCVTTELAVVVVAAVRLLKLTGSSAYVGRHAS